MGALEEKLREVLSEVITGDLLNDTVDQAMSAVADVIGLWAKSREVGAEEIVSEAAVKRKSETFMYNRGRLVAYRDCWQKAVFDGLAFEDETIEKNVVEESDEYWRKRVEEFRSQAFPEQQ